jgi:hypothetical protein
VQSWRSSPHIFSKAGDHAFFILRHRIKDARHNPDNEKDNDTDENSGWGQIWDFDLRHFELGTPRSAASWSAAPAAFASVPVAWWPWIINIIPGHVVFIAHELVTK